MNAQTRNNLLQAMHGEAFAFVKYTLFAQQARKNGREEIAVLFEKTAEVERREHFAEEAELAGLVGSDADNLRDAIQGETYEVDKMYCEFADQAAAAGDEAVAARFAEVRRDEAGHRDAFEAALQQLEVAGPAHRQLADSNDRAPQKKAKTHATSARPHSQDADRHSKTRHPQSPK
jgi:rubrerythrin